jgi:hypothetical protein
MVARRCLGDKRRGQCPAGWGTSEAVLFAGSILLSSGPLCLVFCVCGAEKRFCRKHKTHSVLSKFMALLFPEFLLYSQSDSCYLQFFQGRDLKP